jgi:hypothetical protein
VPPLQQAHPDHYSAHPQERRRYLASLHLPASISADRLGVSLLTQALYCLVFLTRYLDLFLYSPFFNIYNTLFKITYILTSFYILYLMLRVYPRSRESESQWRLSFYILLFAFFSTPIFQAIFRDKQLPWSWLDSFRDFSLILESLAVLPQLTLLAHTSVPTVINSYYLLALGSYRALYIPNWIIRWADPKDGFFEPVAVIFGILQTLFYIEFAWIYYRRQKVKLRSGGGVLDGEEFARGLVLGRIIGGDAGKGERRTGGAWRGEGLSVSADEFEVAGEEESEDELELEREQEEGLIRSA